MAHADWLITGLEKVILPSQEIHLTRSCKHCKNKILTVTTKNTPRVSLQS